MKQKLSDVIKAQESIIINLRESNRQLQFENAVLKKYPTWTQEEVVARSATAIDVLAHVITDLRGMLRDEYAKKERR